MYQNQEIPELLNPKNIDELYSLSTEDICSPNSFSLNSQNFQNNSLQKQTNNNLQSLQYKSTLVKSYIESHQQLLKSCEQEQDKNQQNQADNYSTLNNISQQNLSIMQEDEDSGEDIFFTKNGQPSQQFSTQQLIQEKIEEDQEYLNYIIPVQPKIEEAQQIVNQNSLIETQQQQFQQNFNFNTNITNNQLINQENNFQQIINNFQRDQQQQQFQLQQQQNQDIQSLQTAKSTKQQKLRKQINIDESQLTYIQKQQLQSQQNSQTETKNLVKNLGTPLLEQLIKYFKPLNGIEYKKLKELKKLKRKEDLVSVFKISEKVQIKSVEFIQRLIPYIANSKRIVNKKAHMKYIDILIMAAMDPDNFKTFKPVYV